MQLFKNFVPFKRKSDNPWINPLPLPTFVYLFINFLFSERSNVSGLLMCTALGAFTNYGVVKPSKSSPFGYVRNDSTMYFARSL